ncbi:MAG TPA: lipocalin-like domain-containing protein, partial [Casimicrobiaceae bacterium]|nr:lipocalin-like domain-containing protein [Casimicrobiaceae bacterium]
MKRRQFIALGAALALPHARADVVYPDVVPGVAVAFPRDDGAHPTFRNEWWYVTGWLRDAQGRDLGFQVTFFRSRPGVAEASTSAFAPRQLLFAHAAIADPAIGHLIVDELAAREGLGLAYANIGHANVAIGSSGIKALRTYEGQVDPAGHELVVTQIAQIDELAAATELVMDKLARIPVAVVRGYEWEADETSSAQDVVR